MAAKDMELKNLKLFLENQIISEENKKLRNKANHLHQENLILMNPEKVRNRPSPSRATLVLGLPNTCEMRGFEGVESEMNLEKEGEEKSVGVGILEVEEGLGRQEKATRAMAGGASNPKGLGWRKYLTASLSFINRPDIEFIIYIHNIHGI
ncbi:protein LITTLE ZIPPER 2-like isoform X1 [Senna tora]|uniref:Protein LITTLE ZIPPER 2-like isoform X1 n=1 Tax=Senna tora TaxID=362788 RepID=A0A834TUK6_9FABA|nr:protein LITTLE ZIPPER 2-like isoform X1 [Senna tora]